MSTPNQKLEKVVPAELTKQGGVLEGVIRSSDKAKDRLPKQLPRTEWDATLTEHVDSMADGETVEVEVTISLVDSGKRTARLVGVAALAKVAHDIDRNKLLVEADGFVNPYTFVPTLPRSDQHGTRLAGTGLDDAPPFSHARHVDGQWSGTLALTLTTVTPLLLPVPADTQPKDGPRTFDVRVDPKGRPLIHGASFKGALRSAYETVTASRYGVFFEHDDRLAYRVPANAALDLTPARVCQAEDGTRFFRLCRGDAGWLETSRERNEVQYAAWVPAYQVRPAQQLGDLAGKALTELHGRPLHARVVLHQYERHDRGPLTQFQVWRVTHLAGSRDEIRKGGRAVSAASAERSGRLTPVSGTEPRIVRGWLSASGYSIGSKHDERLFVESPDPVDVPLTPEHERFWQSVLRAYDVAQGYNDPHATYSRATTASSRKVTRSRHVPSSEELRGLPEGTLVYVKYDTRAGDITQVHPVMIGRLPFDAAPGELLHPSLRPAQDRGQLSPADRLFGWVPPGRRDDGGETNDGASGYRGRLRVRSITCTTEDWRPASFPPEGVTLAPLSSPKPTQFRFYAAPDPAMGMPGPPRTGKAGGYAPGSGLRGRKMYRWREEKPDHWQPSEARERAKDEKAPGYLALPGHEQHSTQLVRHRGWVRPEATFQVELFLDGVPEAELGALLWLLTRDRNAPLRLGAGKPYGFGVVTAQLDPDRTRLWDAGGVRAGWLRLNRPDPVGAERLTALANRFDATARANEVLYEATESYLKAAAPVTAPVHYPRESPEPQAESYKWFVENDKDKHGRGWALPHVRDPEQRLPYLAKDSNGPGGTRRESGKSQQGPKPASQPVPQQGRGSASGQGAGRPGAVAKGRRGHRPS
ncbi:TIGR03986 family CRISPR-associated RAMP protein [Micromonospora sp. NBC_01405]|uniref:TIGR03986 family type III CRISPR-associated RAMP protein n=1 Tax=Micromonospora sp. NBC_01405 TaxID=2903589 RepID=UPI0032532785